MAPKKKPNATDVYVGLRIRARRIQLARSQGWLAEKLGLAFQQVQKYEKGTNRVGASRLQAIANALELQPSFFLDGGPSSGQHKSAAAASDALLFSQFTTLPYAVDLMGDYSALSNQQRDVVARVARALAGK